jgi:hypothetical protein
VQLVVARWTGIPLEKLTQSDRCVAPLGTTCLHWSCRETAKLLAWAPSDNAGRKHTHALTCTL